MQLPPLDDGLSEKIDIQDGLPFGDSHPIAVWVRDKTVLANIPMDIVANFNSFSMLQRLKQHIQHDIIIIISNYCEL